MAYWAPEHIDYNLTEGQVEEVIKAIAISLCLLPLPFQLSLALT